MFPLQVVEAVIFDKNREHNVATILKIISQFFTSPTKLAIDTVCYHNGVKHSGLVVVTDDSLTGAFLLTPRAEKECPKDTVALLLPAGKLCLRPVYNKLYVSNVVLKSRDVEKAAKLPFRSHQRSLFDFVNNLRKAERQYSANLT